MKFAWDVQPRNYILFACHGANECVQMYNFQRQGGGAKADPSLKAPGFSQTLILKRKDTAVLAICTWLLSLRPYTTVGGLDSDQEG